LDLTTLVTVASLFFGLVVSNAALFGDSLFVRLAVPEAMENSGFTAPTAERLFAANVAQIISAPSPLATPSVQTSSAPSVTMSLAKPFQLQDLVYAVQGQVRSDVVNVSGSLVKDSQGGGLTMFLVVDSQPDPPLTMTIDRADGNANALIQQAARQTMEAIAPFRVANTDLSNAIRGDKHSFVVSKETASRGLRQPWDSSRQGATEIVLLHNLLAVLALRQNNHDLADRQFELAATVPGADRAAYGTVMLNRAFLAIGTKEPAKAAFWFREGSTYSLSVHSDDFATRIKVLGGLVFWAEGRYNEAERVFREVAAGHISDERAHVYLAELLDERGDSAGAMAQRRAAELARRFEPLFPTLAHTWLHVDMEVGGFRDLKQPEGAVASAHD